MSSQSDHTETIEQSCTYCDELTHALVDALMVLGRNGQAVEGMRIAAAALAKIRTDRPEDAFRLNAVMHTLAALDHTRPGSDAPRA